MTICFQSKHELVLTFLHLNGWLMVNIKHLLKCISYFQFGHSALDAVLKSVIGVDKPLVPPCSDESETEAFFRSEYNNATFIFQAI